MTREDTMQGSPGSGNIKCKGSEADALRKRKKTGTAEAVNSGEMGMRCHRIGKQQLDSTRPCRL